jgi:hypothetical protein
MAEELPGIWGEKAGVSSRADDSGLDWQIGELQGVPARMLRGGGLHEIQAAATVSSLRYCKQVLNTMDEG